MTESSSSRVRIFLIYCFTSFELDEDCFETPIKLKELLPFKDEAYLTISLDEIHDTETED